MSEGPAGLNRRLAALVTPSDGDVLRAKRAVLSRLSSGARVVSAELMRTLAVDDGIAAEPQPHERLDVPLGGDVTAIDASVPLLARQRLFLAARIALVELAEEGVLIEIEGPANTYIPIAVQHGNRGYAEQLELPIPAVGSGYALSRRFGGDLLGIIDGDLFTADLEPLRLDARARQCVREAMDVVPPRSIISPASRSSDR